MPGVDKTAIGPHINKTAIEQAFAKNGLPIVNTAIGPGVDKTLLKIAWPGLIVRDIATLQIVAEIWRSGHPVASTLTAIGPGVDETAIGPACAENSLAPIRLLLL